MTERIIETIGCDLDDKWSEVSILTPRGELQRSEPVKTTRQAMTAFFTRPRTHVVIEVGTHSRWLSELLRQLGHKVTVANPRKVKLISQSNLRETARMQKCLRGWDVRTRNCYRRFSIGEARRRPTWRRETLSGSVFPPARRRAFTARREHTFHPL
jgi:transposase